MTGDTRQAQPGGTGAAGGRPARLRDIGVPLAVLLACTAVTIVLLRRWRADLPSPLATHFDGSGRANGFMSWTGNLIATLGFTVGFPLVLLATFALVGRGQLRRFGATLSSGLAVFITVLSLSGVHAQRGLTDAHQARLPGVGLALAVAAGFAAAGLTFWLAPPSPGGPRPASSELPHLPLRRDERAVWTSHDASPIVLVAAGALVILAGGIYLLTHELVGSGITLAAAAVVASLTGVRVRVDQEGLTWRMGVFHRRIPLSHITSARAVKVDPMKYGGWGYRLSGNGQAIVTRRGPGLRITRSGASDLTITVPDAQTGAALLNTLLDRAPTTG